MTKRSGGKSLLYRLLIANVSIWQILVYAVGVFLGMFIVVIAFQFYLDINSDATTDDSDKEFIILSRKVEGLNFGRDKYSLNEVLVQLKQQPWVLDAAPFKAADFNVTASIDVMGHSMSTALFFESVPDEFIDKLPDKWDFNPEDSEPTIPILLPRDYLALYNFGFAASRGLPKIGENVLMTIPLTVSFSGNGRQRYLKARIVGFTSRLNTIAVPSEVIEWGNKEFGYNDSVAINRLIAQLSVPSSNREVEDFIQQYDLEAGGNHHLNDTAARIVNIIIAIVLIVGSFIALLSVALLLISIFLLMHKTKETNRKLLALGFYPRSLWRGYTLVFAFANCVVLCLTIAGLLIIQHKLVSLLDEAGLVAHASVSLPILIAVGIGILITLGCWLTFRHGISEIEKR